VAVVPAALFECLPERRHVALRFGIALGEGTEYANFGDALGLLRACRERPRRHTAKQRYELAPPHSITSSAMASNDGGTVMPSILAVCALMTSSNFDDCGKSRIARDAFRAARL
jgi:hypothetical protein